MFNWNLYVISAEKFSRGRGTYNVMEEAIEGGAEVIQLREKEMTAREMVALGKRLRILASKKGAAFLVNDRVDVAVAVNADGAHVGQEDLPIKEARKILGPKKILGVSARNIEEAVKAEEEGADYIGLGPIFPTSSKHDAAPPLGLEILTAVRRQVKIPLVAIGGLNKDNAAVVIKAGADCLAVISAVVGAPNVRLAAEELKREILQTKESLHKI